ncbi:MAG: hypothetical protein R6U96_15975 [Promethearchaeia archaeon]
MSDTLKSLTVKVDKIKELISNGLYEKAAEEIFLYLDNFSDQADKELVYKFLRLLNLICDKTPNITVKTVKRIQKFINDSNSWLRLVSLEILYQISMFRPNLLLDLIDDLRSRLFDKDVAVRRLTVKLMGKLLLSLHLEEEKLNIIMDEFIEKLLDKDWKTKLHVISTIKKILNQDYTKIQDLEPLLSIVIINLRDEDEDVARETAELLKILGIYFLSKDKIFYVLLNLLYNEEPRVKELIIWLFGEIGKERSSEIIPIIPQIIDLLKTDNYRIQLKVIDALVNISENNFDQIWSNLIESLDTSNRIFRSNLINALYHLGQKNINDIFSYIFEELESPSKNIREAMATVFKRLFEEYQVEIENEITKILYTLESKYWRKRKNIIELLEKICLILDREEITVWIVVEFEKALAEERDSDVRKELITSIENLKKNFKNLDKKIRKIQNTIQSLRERIKEFQKMPVNFRKKLNSYIENFQFNETEIELNKMYNQILDDIDKFHERLNSFRYKRLAFDLIEEWEDTRVQILDELSIIKEFISKIYEEKKSEFKSELIKKIDVLENRIDILKANFEYIKDNQFNVDLDKAISESIVNNEDIEEKFENITMVRKNLFKLDVDIRELLIQNLEFNKIFQDLLKKWVTTKIEIQEYLSELDIQIKEMKEKITKDFSQTQQEGGLQFQNAEFDDLKNQLAFQLLQGHIQSVFSHGFEFFKAFNDNFDNLNSKIELLTRKKKFSQAKKLMEINSNQIQNFISEMEDQIDKLIGKEIFAEKDDAFNLYIRPYLDKWSAAKELIISKLKRFVEKNERNIYLNQIKNYLNIANPISIDLLSSYTELENSELKALLLRFIHKEKLNAKIIDNKVYSKDVESEVTDSKHLLFFKNIKTIGNKISLNFKLTNPSNYKYKDLQIYLKHPSYLNFLRKESFPKIINKAQMKQGAVFEFNYALKINKDKNLSKNISNPNVDEITVNLFYKDQFNIIRKISKRISLLIP